MDRAYVSKNKKNKVHKLHQSTKADSWRKIFHRQKNKLPRSRAEVVLSENILHRSKAAGNITHRSLDFNSTSVRLSSRRSLTDLLRETTAY